MKVHASPYVAGNSVGGTGAFVGRAEVLARVEQLCRDPAEHALLLHGQRRVGKTSILDQLVAELPRRGPFRAARVDLQHRAGAGLGELLRSVGDAFPELMPGEALPIPADPVRELQTRWLGSAGRLAPEERLVLLFDEFDVLADPAVAETSADFFRYLREILDERPPGLRFVFAIGRNVGDLSTRALGMLKGVSVQAVSLLERHDSDALARLSEPDLRWTPAALSALWQSCRGQPYLTQQVCAEVWHRRGGATEVGADAVKMVETSALTTARANLEWLWQGLNPACRFLAAAMARESGDEIAEDRIVPMLHSAGASMVVRELAAAPGLLRDWDIVEAGNGGYRFRVPLLRRWVAENKPVAAVQAELDQLEPEADALFRTARARFGRARAATEEGAARLRSSARADAEDALALNPNHVGAALLLARLDEDEGNQEGAIARLHPLALVRPLDAGPELVRLLLSSARAAVGEAERLARLERVLAFSPGQPEAFAAVQEIWRRRAEEATQDGHLGPAADAWKRAGELEKAEAAREKARAEEIRLGKQEVLGLAAGVPPIESSPEARVSPSTEPAAGVNRLIGMFPWVKGTGSVAAAPTRRFVTVLLGASNAGKSAFVASIIQVCRRPSPHPTALRMATLGNDGTDELAREAYDTLRHPSGGFRATAAAREVQFGVAVERPVMGLWDHATRTELAFVMKDGPGGALLTPSEERAFDPPLAWEGRLLGAAAEADALVLCVDASERATTVLTRLPRLLSMLSRPTPVPVASGPVARWLERLGGRRSLRGGVPVLRASRFLLLLTKVDRLVEDRGMDRWSPADLAARVDPVAQASEIVGVNMLNQIRQALHPDAEFAVGVSSAWGFCAGAGGGFLRAQLDPSAPGHIHEVEDRIRLWRPFGVREALTFLATGEAASTICRINHDTLIEGIQ